MQRTRPSNRVYAELGVPLVIHAGGPTTNYGGSLMRPDTLAAMAEAGRAFVSVETLNRRIGAYVAEVTDAEAGMVVAGAAAGMVLSLAACVTGTDLAAIRRLPDTTGLKDEMVIQKLHRGPYSHMYSFTGARIVEVGNVSSCLPEELAAALTDRTAAVAFLFAPGNPRGGLTLPQVAEIAHARGIPVIVDAAMTVPPRDNLTRYIREGADLVTMSGGKVIRGPQATGLLYGRADLIEAAHLNSSPNHAIGRPSKVAKEEMVGLYAALRSYMDSDEDQMLRDMGELVEIIVDDVGEVDGVRATVEFDDDRYFVPTAVSRLRGRMDRTRRADGRRRAAGRRAAHLRPRRSGARPAGGLLGEPAARRAGDHRAATARGSDGDWRVVADWTQAQGRNNGNRAACGECAPRARQSGGREFFDVFGV